MEDSKVSFSEATTLVDLAASYVDILSRGYSVKKEDLSRFTQILDIFYRSGKVAGAVGLLGRFGAPEKVKP